MGPEIEALGRDKCKYHGGLSIPAGPGHPTWKNGHTSKWVPPAIRRQYDDLMADPELMQHRSQVAVLTVRYRQLVGRLATGESGSLFDDLRRQWGRLNEARQAGDARLVAEALDEVGRLVSVGGREELVWRDIMECCREVQGAKRAELERMAVQHALMTYQEAIELMLMLGQEIVAEIGLHDLGDRANALKQGIARRLDRYLSSRPKLVEVDVPRVIKPEGAVDESGRVGATQPAEGGPQAAGPAGGAEGGLAGAAGPGAVDSGEPAPGAARPAAAGPGGAGGGGEAVVDAEPPAR